MPAIATGVAVVALTGVLGLTGLLGAGSAAAKDAVVGMSEKVFNAMNEAQLLLDAEDYNAARTTLTELLDRKLSDYERAHALNMIGYTWYQQDDIEQATRTYLEAFALEELPASMRVSLLTTLGQINLMREEYVAAEDFLRQLLAMPDQLLPSNQVLLAAALMGQKRFSDALEPLLAAIEAERTSGNDPRENWLGMLSSVYFELGDFRKMREVMVDLVEIYPREQYITNLAALHGELGDQDRQLALMESLLDDDRVSRDSNLRMLVNLYLGEEQPYEAALLLDQELKSGRIESTVSNLELLSQAWMLSAEPLRALEPLAKAAEMSESGELYLRLARLHMDAYHWEEAETAARKALEKGGLRKEGHAWLLRGMAEVNLKRFTEARQRFRKAATYDETENYASQWLGYVESEVARSEVLDSTAGR